MKPMKHKYSIIALAVTALAVFACMTIEKITVLTPDPKTNSELKIQVKATLTPEYAQNAHPVFAMLVPEEWNVEETAKVYFTTSGLTPSNGVPEYEREEMSLIGPDEIEPYTGKPWAEAYKSVVGFMGNKGPVKWVLFKGQTSRSIKSKDDVPVKDPFDLTFDVTFTTGDTPIKWFFAAEYLGYETGFNPEWHYYSGASWPDGGKAPVPYGIAEPISVTGEGAQEDYTKLPLVSTTPGNMRYGDFFSVEFVSKIEEEETALCGEDNVFLCAKATLKDGSVVTLDKADEENKMIQTGDYSFMKYIFLKDFLDLPDGAEVTDLKVWFCDAYKTKIVDSDGNLFTISQVEQ